MAESLRWHDYARYSECYKNGNADAAGYRVQVRLWRGRWRVAWVYCAGVNVVGRSPTLSGYGTLDEAKRAAEAISRAILEAANV